MTLDPNQKPPEAAKPKPTAKTKTAIAREIALKYADLPYAAAKNKVMEETPCAKTTAHTAVKWAQRKTGKAKAAETPKAAEAPALKIIAEPDKKPEFVEEPEAIETVTPEVIAPSQVPTEEQKEQLDLFKSMLRGTYNMLFSKDGLADKYGRSKEQCEMLADQQYFWLLRRYSIDDLQRFDTLLLVGAYATVLGGIAKDYLADRRKKSEEKGETK